jgi:hypothetical protein
MSPGGWYTHAFSVFTSVHDTPSPDFQILAFHGYCAPAPSIVVV